MRAPVEEKQLADDHRQQRVVVPPQLIAPGREDGADAGDLAGHQAASEDPPGQGESLEAAESVEFVEGAQQVCVRGEIGADLVVDPARGVLVELGLVAAEQMDPLLRGPSPKGSASLRATCQQHSDHVEHRASTVRGRWRVQSGVDRLQRDQQTVDHPPADSGRIVVLEPAQIPHPEFAHCHRLGGPDLDSSVVVVRDDRPGPAFGPVLSGQGQARCVHRATSVAVPFGEVSASIRHAWMCFIPRASLSARSRPDRWMY